MPRVAGADPGTSSLDWIILEDGAVRDQCRFRPEELQADSTLPVAWLNERGPFDLVAGPSGYGLPLVRACDCTDRDLALMALVRPDERGRDGGVLRFSAVVRALCSSDLPVVFLPGVIHLPIVPAHRKINRVDLGTADKLCVAALALEQRAAVCRIPYDRVTLCVVELGSAFTACVVLQEGRVVDGLGGTCGPLGWASGGAWDGEVVYILSPLTKRDLFAGGVKSVPDIAQARRLFRESLLRAVGGLRAVTPFEDIVLAGRLLETEPDLARQVSEDLSRQGTVSLLKPLAGAWVKHAAQGAALVADGLAGGRHAALVEHLALRQAAGTVLDRISHPRGSEALRPFLEPRVELPTRAGYDRWAEIYDEEDNALILLEEPHVNRLLGDVAGLAVADIGCGTGRHALRLARAGAQVTAVDFSDAMLRRARAKPGGEAVTFLQHDLAEPLPLPAGSFDRVLCGLVVDHIADLGRCFGELKRLCRPDGAVVVSVMHPAMMLRGIQARFTDPATGRETRPLSYAHQVSDYVMAATRAGFSLDHLGEHLVDAALAARSPRGAKYLGWPLLLVMRLTPLAATPS